MSVNMNQFGMEAVVGKLDLSSPVDALTCRFKDVSETAATTLKPGELVKLVDLGSSDIIGPPIVDEMADDNDGGAFGVKLWTTKENESVDGDIVQIGVEGAIVTLESSAAIVRGATVSAVLATPGQVVTTTTEDQLGIALDKASASGKLIRIKIKPVAVST